MKLADMATQARGRAPADAQRGRAEAGRRARRRRSRHGEAVRERDRVRARDRVDAHPRRRRLHDRAAGRALLPRRAADDHRRGHQRDPAPRDRPRPPGARRRATSDHDVVPAAVASSRSPPCVLAACGGDDDSDADVGRRRPANRLSEDDYIAAFATSIANPRTRLRRDERSKRDCVARKASSTRSAPTGCRRRASRETWLDATLAAADRAHDRGSRADRRRVLRLLRRHRYVDRGCARRAVAQRRDAARRASATVETLRTFLAAGFREGSDATLTEAEATASSTRFDLRPAGRALPRERRGHAHDHRRAGRVPQQRAASRATTTATRSCKVCSVRRRHRRTQPAFADEVDAMRHGCLTGYGPDCASLSRHDRSRATLRSLLRGLRARRRLQALAGQDDHRVRRPLFCMITMNHHPLHTDAWYAERADAVRQERRRRQPRVLARARHVGPRRERSSRSPTSKSSRSSTRCRRSTATRSTPRRRCSRRRSRRASPTAVSSASRRGATTSAARKSVTSAAR